MSNVHQGLRAEYAAVECRRRAHPLVVKRRRMIERPKGPYGGPYKAPGVYEHWLYCVCGAYRAAVKMDTRVVVDKRQRVDVLP